MNINKGRTVWMDATIPSGLVSVAHPEAQSPKSYRGQMASGLPREAIESAPHSHPSPVPFGGSVADNSHSVGAYVLGSGTHRIHQRGDSK